MVLIRHQDREKEGVVISQRETDRAADQADPDRDEEGESSPALAQEGKENVTAVQWIEGNEVHQCPQEVDLDQIAQDQLPAGGQAGNRRNHPHIQKTEKDAEEDEAEETARQGDPDRLESWERPGRCGGGGSSQSVDDDLRPQSQEFVSQGVPQLMPEDRQEHRKQPRGQQRDPVGPQRNRSEIQERRRDPEVGFNGDGDPEDAELNHLGSSMPTPLLR